MTREGAVDRLHNDAQRLRGISSMPGKLRTAGGTLSFTCSGTGSAWLFQLPRLGHVVQQPLLAATREATTSFDRGITLRSRFGRSASTSDRFGGAMGELREVRTMRQRGALWVSALAHADPTPHASRRSS